jgi:archaeal preflagellin peptidase FlaK
MLVPDSTDLLALRVAILLGGLGFAAYQDLKVREVSDGVWQVMGLIGAAIGFVVLWGSPLAIGLWAMVSIWALEHLFAWEAPLERYSERLPGWVELGLYIVVFVTIVVCAVEFGVGGSGVPIAVIGVAGAILLARGLFEVGVLYGGADAKALMIAGLLIPIDAAPLWSPSVAAVLLGYYPFALTVLIDAALFAIVVPIAIAIRNLSAHEFVFPRGFTGYMIPVHELPERYVWIKDPMFSGGGSDDEPEPQTTEEDRALRQRQADELTRKGVARVWVTPQLPFILWILAGTVGAVVAGNLLFDLIAAL